MRGIAAGLALMLLSCAGGGGGRAAPGTAGLPGTPPTVRPAPSPPAPQPVPDSPERAFQREVVDFARRNELYVGRWGTVTLDDDPALEWVAQLCPIEVIGEGAYLVRDDGGRRWNVTHDDETSSDTEGCEERPKSPPPWRPFRCDSVTCEHGGFVHQHHGGGYREETTLALRGGELVVVRVDGEGSTGGIDQHYPATTNWDELEYTSDHGAGPIIPVLGPGDSAAGVPPNHNSVVANRGAWMGVADARVSLTARQASAGEITLDIVIVDDQPLPAKGASAAAIMAVDHLDLALPASGDGEGEAVRWLGIGFDAAGKPLAAWLPPRPDFRPSPADLPKISGGRAGLQVAMPAELIDAEGDSWHARVAVIYEDHDRDKPIPVAVKASELWVRTRWVAGHYTRDFSRFILDIQPW